MNVFVTVKTSSPQSKVEEMCLVPADTGLEPEVGRQSDDMAEDGQDDQYDNYYQ